MTRLPINHLVDAKLAELEGGGGRYIDMRMSLKAEKDGRRLLNAGGRWDLKAKDWVKNPDGTRLRPKKSRILRLHPGQVAWGEWFASWMVEHHAGRTIVEDGRDIWSVALFGGRRSGKTDGSSKAGCAYAVDIARSIVWFVVESFPDMPEIVRAIQECLPRSWYDPLGAPHWKWTLANGSEIHIKSAHDIDDLKRGRVDLAIVVEAQKHEHRVFTQLRAPTADKGGIVILTANPPNTIRGEWVAEYVQRTEANKGHGKVFHLDPRLNPHQNYRSLEALADEVDPDEYDRDVLGRIVSIKDRALHAWSDALNIKAMPETGDVTRAFAERHFDAPADQFLGADFQLIPHMAGLMLRAFVDPADPSGEPLLWYFAESIVDEGDEDAMIDSLEADGFRGEDTIVIGDASGEWQDAKREKGRGSFDHFRRRGWKRIYTPDVKSKKNPLIDQRVAAANARFCSASGKRRVFMDPSCLRARTAFRKWGRKGGIPDRKSKYAHLCDAGTYPLWRFYPRRADPEAAEYIAIDNGRRSRERSLREREDDDDDMD
jgi:hypothetical protein